ncbi:cell division protein FtsW [Arcanobacterium pluranimalium]|uniref:FtsW/RodA/SpoVE family cell cycle protein n=1 Tax=Arcanobacterium pluranimalium TaxID=108028 RepID=UPI00195B4FAF|nr:putative peptidoglycan glycosyltransferase FtsW [Arcanobacterium pluranimalium]MBM7825595.1 cell division protein FtsW [Arcanobacterium pluranimalium]
MGQSMHSGAVNYSSAVNRGGAMNRSSAMNPTPVLFAEPIDPPVGQTRELTQNQRERRDAVQRSVITLLVASTILLIIGIFMVFSATSASSIRAVDRYGEGVGLFSVAIRQVFWAVLGVIGAVVLAILPYRLIERMCYVIFAGACIMQLAVVFFGKEVAGNTNWLKIGGLQLQPSEFLKLAVIVWLAHVIGRLRVPQMADLHALALPVGGLTIATGLVLLPGDMGTSIVYVLIGLGMLWLAGLPLKYLGIVFGAGIVGAGALIAIQPSRLSRVTSYFNNLFSTPGLKEPSQADFAQFAFGTGGWSGLGIGAGKEKWRDLKEAHTDFIFAVIGEELGLFGSIIIVVLFLVLAWAFLRLIVNHPFRYGQLLSAGAGLWICGQAFLNMCVVTGLLPVFGVPLPFLSQGGSALMATLFMIGIVISCAMSVPGVKESLRIRSTLVHRARAVLRRKDA